MNNGLFTPAQQFQQSMPPIGQVPRTTQPLGMPSEGQPMLPPMGQPNGGPPGLPPGLPPVEISQNQMPVYVGDPLIDKYIHMFIGNDVA